MKLFDTTVLVAYLRGVERAQELLDPAVLRAESSVSVLSRIEVEGAMRSHERAAVARMFSGVIMQPVTDLIASRAGQFVRQYRRSHAGIDIVDFVIAATADVLGAELVTLNVRHFPMVKGLKPAF